MSEKFADRQRKFYNANMQKLLKKHQSLFNVFRNEGIGCWTIQPLKNDMWKQFTLNGNYKWINLLPHLISKYNAWKHQTIGIQPIDVTPVIDDKLLTTVVVTTVYNRIKIATPAQFKVSDSERVNKCT